MSNDEVVVPISDSLSNALSKLFKLGGFALAFGFAGLLLTLTANFSPEQLTLPMFAVGSVLTFACLSYFLVSSLRTRQVAQRLKDDLPLLDTLQRAALQVTEFASVSQAFAFKHLTKIQKAIETVSPMIEALPLVGPAARSAGLTDSAKISGLIVSTTESTKDVVLGLQDAIRSGNLKAIQLYTMKLESVLAELKTSLRSDA